jgi:hypothetical protein
MVEKRILHLPHHTPKLIREAQDANRTFMKTKFLFMQRQPYVDFGVIQTTSNIFNRFGNLFGIFTLFAESALICHDGFSNTRSNFSGNYHFVFIQDC